MVKNNCFRKGNYSMKTIYMREVLKDIWKKKILVIVCLFACICAGITTGYKKTNFYDRLSAKDKMNIDSYYEQLGKYEQGVNDAENCIKLLTNKIFELKDYIDNSIFMHLNPDIIFVANVQFSTPSSIAEADFLEDKYLSEVLSVSSKKNIFNISVMHVSEEQALFVINDIVKKIEVKNKISTPIITCYTKTDGTIVDKQKECLDNYKGYIKNRIDLISSLRQQNALVSKYKSEKKPKVLSKKELKPISVIFRYSLFGFIAGVLGIISIFTIRRIL